MVILKKGERADSCYGIETDYITDEMISALKEGKRLYTTIQGGEYALILKHKGKKKTNSWHKLPDTENMLQDHYFYLVRHIEFGTPMKAKFHADGEPHFEIYGCNHGAGKMIVYEHEFGNHITHWMDMPDLPAESEG